MKEPLQWLRGEGVSVWGWVSRLCAWLLGHSSVGAQRRQGNQLGEVGVAGCVSSHLGA